MTAARAPRVLQDMAKLALSEQVNEDADQAKPRAGEIDGQELGSVARHQSKGVALLEAECGKTMGDPVGPGIEVAIGPTPVAVTDHLSLWKARGATGDEVTNIDTVDQMIGHGRLTPAARMIVGEEISMPVFSCEHPGFAPQHEHWIYVSLSVEIGRLSGRPGLSQS